MVDVVCQSFFRATESCFAVKTRRHHRFHRSTGMNPVTAQLPVTPAPRFDSEQFLLRLPP